MRSNIPSNSVVIITFGYAILKQKDTNREKEEEKNSLPREEQE